MEQYEKIYLYKRIVQAKLFIDDHYAENIDLNNIADQAHFQSSILSGYSNPSMEKRLITTSYKRGWTRLKFY